MTHAPYILAAYGGSAAVLLGMIGWVAFDLRAQNARLRRLAGEAPPRRG